MDLYYEVTLCPSISISNIKKRSLHNILIDYSPQHIPFDPSRISSEDLQYLLFAFQYHDQMGEASRDVYKSYLKIENIFGNIKDGIKQTYDRLYDILLNFESDAKNIVNKFTVSFYQSSQKGIDANAKLKTDQSGTQLEINIDRNDLTSFHESLLSIVCYLAEYPYSFAVIRISDSERALYVSLSEILNEEFMKTNFGGKRLGGSLNTFAIKNYEKWKSGYFDEQQVYHPGWNQHPEHWASGRPLWTTMNIFPIYLFSGASSKTFGRNDFAAYLINYFGTLTGERYEGIDELLRLT